MGKLLNTMRTNLPVTQREYPDLGESGAPGRANCAGTRQEIQAAPRTCAWSQRSTVVGNGAMARRRNYSSGGRASTHAGAGGCPADWFADDGLRHQKRGAMVVTQPRTRCIGPDLSHCGNRAVARISLADFLI